MKKAYQRYKIQRNKIRRLAKSYSFGRLSENKKLIRGITAVALFQGSLIGMVILAENTKNADLKSYALWLYIALAATCICGIYTIAVGFLRALLPISIAAGMLAVMIWAGLQLSVIWGQSVIKFLMYAGILLFLFVLILFSIYKIYRRKTAMLHLASYEIEQTFISVDLNLKDLLPFEEYTSLIRCTIVFEPQKGIPLIHDIVAGITSCANRKKLFFCGFIMDASNKNILSFTFYIYAEYDCSAAFGKILSKFKSKNFRLECDVDAEWSVYLDTLYPDKYTLNTIGNRNLHAYLTKKRYDFSKPVSLIYTLVFCFKYDAMDCMEEAEFQGYRSARYESNTEYVARNGLPEKFSHIIYIQNDCMAGLEQLNAQINRIMKFAEKFNGELHNFDLGQLTVQQKKD